MSVVTVKHIVQTVRSHNNSYFMKLSVASLTVCVFTGYSVTVGDFNDDGKEGKNRSRLLQSVKLIETYPDYWPVIN